MDTQLYLERIGLSEAPELTEEGLDQVVWAHQITVPFEDLDNFVYKKEISLDTDYLFNKVVVQKRGGYCYEMNGIFCSFLQALGFEAYNDFVRVRDGGADPGVSHRGIVVTIDGLIHYADVGFGGPMPSFAVPMDGKWHTHHGETFRTELDPEDPEWVWMKQLKTNAEGEQEEISVFKFGLTPRTVEEFEPLNRKAWHPDTSSWQKRRIVNLRMENGHRSITNDVYAELINGQRTEIMLDESNTDQILKEKFGIVLPE